MWLAGNIVRHGRIDVRRVQLRLLQEEEITGTNDLGQWAHLLNELMLLEVGLFDGAHSRRLNMRRTSCCCCNFKKEFYLVDIGGTLRFYSNASIEFKRIALPAATCTGDAKSVKREQKYYCLKLIGFSKIFRNSTHFVGVVSNFGPRGRQQYRALE